MLSPFVDFNRTFQALDLLRRRMDEPLLQADAEAAAYAGPPVNIYESGAAYVVQADLPGFRDGDLEIFVNQNVVTVRGERKLDAPEGFTPRRRERDAGRFERSFAFNTRLDAEKVSAELSNGVLRLTLPKVAEAQPRQISVKTSS